MANLEGALDNNTVRKLNSFLETPGTEEDIQTFLKDFRSINPDISMSEHGVLVGLLKSTFAISNEELLEDENKDKIKRVLRKALEALDRAGINVASIQVRFGRLGYNIRNDFHREIYEIMMAVREVKEN